MYHNLVVWMDGLLLLLLSKNRIPLSIVGISPQTQANLHSRDAFFGRTILIKGQFNCNCICHTPSHVFKIGQYEVKGVYFGGH